jgi:hypothetical protein
LTGNVPVTQQLGEKVNAAAAEGQANVESAKATGAGYVGQAKDMASSALATATVMDFNV